MVSHHSKITYSKDERFGFKGGKSDGRLEKIKQIGLSLFALFKKYYEVNEIMNEEMSGM